ncbi:MAG: hypothetical protein R2873_02205 [Caldilineaceae bacterium]
MLAGLCGTPSAYPGIPRGHIPAIEDVDERPYAVDFALTQMHLAGKLDGVIGLMAGSFQHNETYGYGGPTTDEILAKERNPGRPHRCRARPIRPHGRSARHRVRGDGNLRRARSGLGLSAGTTEIEWIWARRIWRITGRLRPGAADNRLEFAL